LFFVNLSAKTSFQVNTANFYTQAFLQNITVC
jgi:hypothetical protein